MNILITSDHRLESFLEISFVRKPNGVLVLHQGELVFFYIDDPATPYKFTNSVLIEQCASELLAKQKFIQLLERKTGEQFYIDTYGIPSWCVQSFLEYGWKGELQTVWNPWIFPHPPKKHIYQRVFGVCQTAQLYLLSLVSENREGDPKEWSFEVQRYIQSHVGSRFGQKVGLDKTGGILSYEFVVSKLGVQSYLSGTIVLGEMEVEFQRWGVEVLKGFEYAVREIQHGMTCVEVRSQVEKFLPSGSIVKIEPLWSKTVWVEGSQFRLEEDGAYYVQAWVNIQRGDESPGILRLSNVIRIDKHQCDFEYVFLPEMIHVP